MDASDGANHNGNGHADPSPESLPTTPAAPAGAPSEVSPVEASAVAPVKRKSDGTFQKGQSGNPRGNWKRTPTLNTQLIAALKKFKVTDNQGVDHSFLEALLKRALTEPTMAVKLMDKVFADATPTAPMVKAEIHNNPVAAVSTTNHVNVAKLLETAEGRDGLAAFVERLSNCGAYSGESGHVRQ